jgi:FlaA1/EpsC-like NDP-sugar epimerase
VKTRTKKLFYGLIDSALVMLAVGLSIWILHIDIPMLTLAERALLLLSPLIAVSLFYLMGLYEAVLRYLSFKAVFTVLKSVSLFSLVWAMGVWLFTANLSSVTPLLVWVFLLVLIGGSRFLRSWQFAYFGDGYGLHKDRKNVLIYGAGTAGVQLATLLSYGNKHIAHAFIDDSRNLQDRVVEGYKVYSSKHIQHLIDKYKIEEVLMAIPSASRSRRKRILSELEPFRVHVRSLPSLEEIVNCEVKIDDIREVDIMDLLGRDPVPADSSLLDAPIEQKVVMVTGAAGSIGSELCRQIALLSPRCLILFEQHEFSLYALSKELESSGVEVISILGSVVDQTRVKRVIDRYQVDTIYHAAAYKHVPMVEHNPSMGVLNNILGTFAVAQAACDSSVRNFVLISTDKAVRPTNIMGATKRVAELVIQAMDVACEGVCYSAVRFGNVIGSSGSVIPLFREQIRNGGPVTVTHPEITRFFMTVPEAAQLVIQAGSLATGGEIFVLDMGKPVKINQMARHMIQLSGLTVADDLSPDGDIEIVYPGLRSGEKLYEELLIDGDVSGTRHSRIMCANESSLSLSELASYIERLRQIAHRGDTPELVSVLAQLVDGYQAKAEVVDIMDGVRREETA